MVVKKYSRFFVCNNIDRIGWTFQIVLLNLEDFKDGKQFLVMCVIIQLRHSKSAGVKSNWMIFIIFINNGEDCSESIVRGISFHNELSIRNPMSKDRSGGKCFLEKVESILTGRVELPRNILPNEVLGAVHTEVEVHRMDSEMSRLVE